MAQIPCLNSKHLSSLRKCRSSSVESLLNAVLVLFGCDIPTRADLSILISDSRKFTRKLRDWNTERLTSSDKVIKLQLKKLRQYNPTINLESISDPILRETVVVLKTFVLNCKTTLESQSQSQLRTSTPQSRTSRKCRSTSPACRTLSPQRLFNPVVKNIQLDMSNGAIQIADTDIRITKFINDLDGEIGTLVFSGNPQTTDFLSFNMLEKIVRSTYSVLGNSISSCKISDSDFIDTTISDSHKVLSANTLKESFSDLKSQSYQSATSVLEHINKIVLNSPQFHHLFKLGVGLVVAIISQHSCCRISKHHLLQMLRGSDVGSVSNVRAHILSRVLSNSRALDLVLHLEFCESTTAGDKITSPVSLLRNRSKMFEIRYGDPPELVKQSVELFLLLLGEQPGVGWTEYQRGLCQTNLLNKMTHTSDSNCIRVSAHVYRRITKLRNVLKDVTDTGSVVADELKRWSLQLIASGKVGPRTTAISRSRSRSRSASVGRHVNCLSPTAISSSPPPEFASPAAHSSIEWLKFCRSASRDISELDLLRISRDTLVRLISLYGFSHPITAARIELYWLDNNTAGHSRSSK